MLHASTRIATLAGADSAELQALLATKAAEWRADGIKVAGLIAEPNELPPRICSAGILREINSGKPHTIYLDTAPTDTSCHLDAAGVHSACESILNQIAACDLLILSKFGKLEASGAGLTEAFKAAMAAGKPILTTVSAKHRSAWRTFAPDAVDLPADRARLQRWWDEIAAE